MPSWSRRQTLSALAGGVVAALAGCRGDDSSTGPTPYRHRRVDTYEVEHVRNTDGAALVTTRARLADASPGAREYLTNDEDLADLTFAALPEARTLHEFATATDFESKSVYLYATDLPSCYDYPLQWVEVDANGPSAHFCRDLRPADVECRTDVSHTVAYAIRLPFPGDEYSGLGSGMSSSCRRPPRPEPFDANVTLVDGGDDR